MFLETIIEQKKREVVALNENKQFIMQLVESRQIKKDFRAALAGENLAVIAEVKRSSPSRGLLNPIADVSGLLQSYVDGGCAAISVLTDNKYFSGGFDDLQFAAHYLKSLPQPVLCKEFIIDPIQLYKAKSCGADAVLLIVAVLGDQTSVLYNIARSLGLHVLVEVHDRDELAIAIDCKSEIIGINNRNLATLEVNCETALQLKPYVPADVIAVAESGLRSIADLQQMADAGFDAVLVGEALVTHQINLHELLVTV